MDEQLSVREAARFAMVRRSVVDDEALARAFRNALKLSAETLNVDRVGIWMYEEEGALIRCDMLFDRRTGDVAPGEVIDLRECPRYAEALKGRRVVMASDAREDPRTAELGSYLVAHGITGLLDCPVFEQGDAVGVVCHEHVGPQREWSAADRYFAATVADMLGLYLEQRASQQHYKALLEARQELEQRRVMESLGRMAANVAHDFNNVLLAVQLSTESQRRRAGATGRGGGGGGDVLRIVDQGRRLVRQLLDFAKQDQSPTSVIDIGQVLRELEATLTTLAGEDITLELQLPDDPLWVRLERSGAEQIAMNLVKNAVDALVGGGRVSVSLLSEPGAPGSAAARVARLRVEDNGVGMDEATHEMAFEPFFTTKPRGEGDGLGLSTVYALVVAAGGDVAVVSAPGEGTNVCVSLPCLDGPSA